jgi:transcription elongation factor Elf1
MECPYCNADCETSDLNALNNPNLVSCGSCGESFFVHVCYERYAVKNETEGYTCDYSIYFPDDAAQMGELFGLPLDY